MRDVTHRQVFRFYSVLDDEPFLPFDNAVLRYIWKEGSGQDLDTRTALLNVDPSINGMDVGWSRYGTNGGPLGAIVGPPGSTVLSGPFYLFWGGDNTGTDAAEGVAIDFSEIESDYPSLSTVSIRLRAFWYSLRDSGLITVQFETYSGGILQRSGTDFVNVGGSVVQTRSFSVNVQEVGSGNRDGNDLGLLVYDTASKTAYFTENIGQGSFTGAITQTSRLASYPVTHRKVFNEYSVLEKPPYETIGINWRLYEPTPINYEEGFSTSGGWSLRGGVIMGESVDMFNNGDTWDRYSPTEDGSSLETYGDDNGWDLADSENVGDAIELFADDTGWTLYP